MQVCLPSMYATYFGLEREPFSIAPDPRTLFMSERHREALAHLLYGLDAGGGFVLLTGEIGTGKTTICRCFLEQIPANCNVAYIFNPKLTVLELLQTIGDEFHIAQQALPQPGSVKDHVDRLNAFLLHSHAQGQRNVLIIDEAQNLSADVLEQLRLLTNLETSERKLLQIILIGQPELRAMLATPQMEQLAQRVIARFHLQALSAHETAHYIAHRLQVAGLKGPLPFERPALQRIAQLTGGVPRRINLLCDRALLGAYASGAASVNPVIVRQAAREVFDTAPRAGWRARWAPGLIAVSLAAGLLAGLVMASGDWKLGSMAALGAKSNNAVAAPAAAQITAIGVASVAASAPVASSNQRLTVSASAPVPALAAPLGPAELKAALARLPRLETDGWRALAGVWGVAAPQTEPCLALLRQNLHCFKKSGSLALLRQLDRPGLLAMYDERNSPAYALLLALGTEHATLDLDGGPARVSLDALAEVWRGEFATLWRAPEGYRHKLQEGDSGPAVMQLAQQLARHNGTPPPVTTPRLNAALRASLQAFQLEQELQPDGSAGPMTFMRLNRATGVSEPVLGQPRSSAVAQTQAVKP